MKVCVQILWSTSFLVDLIFTKEKTMIRLVTLTLGLILASLSLPSLATAEGCCQQKCCGGEQCSPECCNGDQQKAQTTKKDGQKPKASGQTAKR